MCTAISFKTHNHYFGRTLDLDRSYGEEVCVMPRNFVIDFRKAGKMPSHYAMIGMVTVVSGIPLFYDASNEYGLCVAGLNFPENAYYSPIHDGKDNISPFEFIPWILGKCKNVTEARLLLDNINLADIAFNKQFPNSPLHWMISDSTSSIIVEAMKDGLHVHNNPVNVLTNNPPFEYQLENLKNYQHLRIDNKEIKKEENLDCSYYCQGLGAIGLPGDVSSMSRFVRAAFTLENSACKDDEISSVTQFFHILDSVKMVRGTCKTDEDTWDITGYSACINTDRGLYYYTTYDNRRISCIDMHKTDLNSDKAARFPLAITQSINYQN